jgi:hypothetical protein
VTASPLQIIGYIRARKIIVIPGTDEEGYFERVKTLARAKKFVITGIEPYYQEGVFGKVPTNSAPPDFVTPFADVMAVADFGSSNLTVQVISPILSPEGF